MSYCPYVVLLKKLLVELSYYGIKYVEFWQHFECDKLFDQLDLP